MLIRSARTLGLLALLFATSSVAETPETLSFEAFRTGGPSATPLLILGTFHFKDAGRDNYKPEVDIDVLSPARQAEVAEVVERLAAFRPTRIALEARGDRAIRLAEEYQAYRNGDFELKSNEIYQLGFRLAHALGHDSVAFVDAEGRRYDLESGESVAARCGQDPEFESEWHHRYMALYRHGDRSKADRSLLETFIAINDEERLLAGHGHYLIDGFHLGCGDNYRGADNVTGWWYNRNLRIFANLGRIRAPDSRILLIIGAGHVPILRHAAQASPEWDLVDVEDVLGD